MSDPFSTGGGLPDAADVSGWATMRDKDNLAAPGTFSKDPVAWGVDFQPQALVKGLGCRVLGSDGHWYVDWVSGLGANLLGYGDEGFLQALADQARDGICFSLPHPLEYEVAELLAERLGSGIPSWDPADTLVRFCKTGTEATTMAIRLARATTGEWGILKAEGAYHGWADWNISTEPPAHGVPSVYARFVRKFTWGSEASLREMGPTGWAGLIVEPPLEALDPANVSFLKFLQGFCRENSILFVLDEVVTSLRFGMAGIAGRLGLEPDLICVGKGLGNGLPIAALVGRKKYMEKFRGDSPVFCSSTNWGEALSLASARCVLTRWGLPEVAHIWKLGERLMDGLVKAGWFVRGHPPRSLVAFRSQEERAFFICGMRDRGILMNRPNFPNLAHSAWDVDATVKVAEDLRKELDSIPEDQLKRDWSARVPRALFQAR